MQNPICGTINDIDLDTQVANETLVCLYAEYCLQSNLTAKKFAIHCGRGAAVTVGDLIGATRFHVMHSNGFVQQVLPLIQYIMRTGHIPHCHSAKSSNLVSESVAKSIFRHLNGVRRIRNAKALNASEALGNALYQCLLTGCILSEEQQVVYTECPCTKSLCTFCSDFKRGESEWINFNPLDPIVIYLKDYSNQIEKRLLQSIAV